jgi:hypothetical protein
LGRTGLLIAVPDGDGGDDYDDKEDWWTDD